MRPTLSALFVACAALSAGCDVIGVDKKDERGTTALMQAAARGDTADVLRLIARGADVNAEVPRRDLREMIAFASGDQDLPASDIGYTPLLYAAKSRNPRVAAMLIENGADVHHATRTGVTAFRIAFDRSDVRIMQLLTVAGVRPTREQLMHAVERSPPEVLALLLQGGADPNEYLHPGNRTPIVVTATKRGDPEVVRLLIDAKANVNARDANGWTPLRWARDAQIRRKSPGVTQLIALLEAAGARDDGGVKAVTLFDAVQKKDIARVRAALRSGANPNARDNHGVRPLVHAATQGSTEIVAALIAAGAHLNSSAFAPYGPTALNAAIENGHVAVVKQLLAAGANSNQRDSRGMSPLMVASINKRADMTALLLADSAKAEPRAFSLAVRSGDTAQIRPFLDYGANPNASNGHALWAAVRGCRDRDNTDVVRLLLDRGADPKAVKLEFTDFYVLHSAAQWCTPETVALLVARGADPNARDHQRRTPLFAAAAAGKLESVRILINAGADVNVRDADGSTVLMHVRDRNVRQELLRVGAIMPTEKASGRATRVEGVKP